MLGFADVCSHLQGQREGCRGSAAKLLHIPQIHVAAPPLHQCCEKVIAEEIGIATHDKITGKRFTPQVSSSSPEMFQEILNTIQKEEEHKTGRYIGFPMAFLTVQMWRLKFDLGFGETLVVPHT